MTTSEEISAKGYDPARDGEDAEPHGLGPRSAAFWRKLRSGRIDLGLFLRPIMPRRLYARSLIIIVAPMVLLQAVLTYIFFDAHWDEVTRRLSKGVAGDIATVVDLYERRDPNLDIAQIRDLAANNMKLSVAEWPSDTLPRREQRALLPLLDKTLEGELNKRLDREFWFDTTSYPEHIDIRVKTDLGVLRIIAQRKRVSASNAPIFIVWMFGASAVLIVVAVLFLRNQIRPIQRLAFAAERFGKGRTVDFFKPSGATEVRAAGQAFLDMKERIERHITQRTEMLAGVSHDLRTPLTRLKLQIAMLGNTEDLEDMKSDIQEMERMLEEYLSFARGQAGEEPEAIELGPFLEDLVERFRAQEEAVGLERFGELEVTARPNALRRVVTNLLDNALRHGSRAVVTARRVPEGVEIRVDDDGPGIAEERREEAFRPFHRLDEGRNLDAGGVGLGLAVSRDIVRGHGGELTLAHSPLGGLRAVVRLPV